MASSTCSSRRPISRATARVLLLAALSATPGPAAAADTAAAKGAAQDKLVEGVGLLKDRRYSEALDRFKQAYGLVPSPLINYDFGLAYLGMGDDARALESFEAFLDAGRAAPADKRRKAEGYRNELRGRVAVVELGADVDAAELAVDQQSLGRVSFPRRLYLAPGSHEMVARAGPGGPTYAASVTCGAGQTAGIEIRLRRRGARSRQQRFSHGHAQRAGQWPEQLDGLVVAALAQARRMQRHRHEYRRQRRRQHRDRFAPEFGQHAAGREAAPEFQPRHQQVEWMRVQERGKRGRERWLPLQAFAASRRGGP